MEDTRKPVGLLEGTTNSIIRTNYGACRIAPCFGFMDIQNPFEVVHKPFLNEQEMVEIKKDFTRDVREVLSKTGDCITCYLFDKCSMVSLMGLIRKNNDRK